MLLYMTAVKYITRVEPDKMSDAPFMDSLKPVGVVKSSRIVIPGLIRYPEAVEFTGFRLPPE